MAHTFFCSPISMSQNLGNGWIILRRNIWSLVTCTLVASTSEMLDEDTIFEFTLKLITWLDNCEANIVDGPADVDGLSVTDVTSLQLLHSVL